MRKTTKSDSDEMRPEYDLSSGGVPNPYAAHYVKGTNLVLIEPDIFKFFPSEKDVNSALRMLVKLSGKATVAASAGHKAES